MGQDDAPIRGRRALEEAYAKFFTQKPGPRIEMTSDSLRFLSRDSAIEEGTARVQKGKAERPVTSRYSTLYVREDGHWLIAVLRELPVEGVTLRDLDWLVGAWTGKTGDGEVRST